MSDQNSIRINKYLSERGPYSRRGIDKLINEKRILVNGKLIAQGEVVISNEKFCAKINSVIPPEERVKKMAGMDKIVDIQSNGNTPTTETVDDEIIELVNIGKKH